MSPKWRGVDWEARLERRSERGMGVEVKRLLGGWLDGVRQRGRSRRMPRPMMPWWDQAVVVRWEAKKGGGGQAGEGEGEGRYLGYR
jgi:hypothetical protein